MDNETLVAGGGESWPIPTITSIVRMLAPTGQLAVRLEGDVSRPTVFIYDLGGKTWGSCLACRSACCPHAKAGVGWWRING